MSPVVMILLPTVLLDQINTSYVQTTVNSEVDVRGAEKRGTFIAKAETLLRRNQVKEAILLLTSAKSGSKYEEGMRDILLLDAYYRNDQYANAVDIGDRVLFTEAKNMAKVTSEDGTVIQVPLAPGEQLSDVSRQMTAQGQTSVNVESDSDGTIQLAPATMEFILEYAVALCKVGQWEMGRRVYAAALPRFSYAGGKPVYKVLPQNSFNSPGYLRSHILGSILASLGMFYYHSGEDILSEKALRDALVANENDVCANYYLAMFLQLRDKDKEAQVYLSKAKKYGGRQVSDALDKGGD